MTKLRGLILDVDGLMADTEPLHMRAMNLLLLAANVDYTFEREEYGRRFVGISVGENAEYIRERFGLGQTADDLQRAHVALFGLLIADANNVSPMPGLGELLAAAERQGLVLAVASGSETEHVAKILRALNVANRFQNVACGTGQRPKPAPDIYQNALANLKLDPKEALAVEDSRSGVQSARAAGMRVIAVRSEFTCYQDLSEADAIVPELSGVEQYLNQ